MYIIRYIEYNLDNCFGFENLIFAADYAALMMLHTTVSDPTTADVSAGCRRYVVLVAAGVSRWLPPVRRAGYRRYVTLVAAGA